MRNIRHSVFFKLSLAFMMIGLVPLSVLSYLSFMIFSQQVERYTNNSMGQMLLNFSYNVDNMYSNYNKISQKMYFDDDETTRQFEATFGGGDGEHAAGNQYAVDYFLKTLLYSDRYIRNVFFVREADRQVFFQSKVIQRLNKTVSFPPPAWEDTLADHPKRLAFYPPHEEAYFHNARKQQVITFGRNFIDTTGAVNNPKIFGTLYFDVDIEVFNDMFGNIQLDKRDEIQIVDEEGYVLFSNHTDKIGSISHVAMNGVSVEEGEGGDIVLLTQPIPSFNGKITAHISKTALFQGLTQINTTVTTVIVICIIALLILSIAFSKFFSKPILGIMKQMRKVESGNLDARVKVMSNDEIGQLSDGFNQMVERLNIFINEAYIAETRQKQMELNALKSQIRPHFLYNTLEVIRMKAVDHDDAQVAEMIEALSNQLKYVIDYGEEWVTISQEIRQMTHYFKLIQIRYENRITLKMDMEEEVSPDWGILKLSIQPIVENAVQHGLKPKSGKGMVKVSVKKLNSAQLQILVYDDGIGMDAETVTRMNAQLTGGAPPSGRSIGLKNVNERIKTLCGHEYGLEVNSIPHVGTSVRMLFPLVQAKEEKALLYSESGRTYNEA